MILFLGTRPGKEEIRKLYGIICPFCNQNKYLDGIIAIKFLSFVLDQTF